MASLFVLFHVQTGQKRFPQKFALCNRFTDNSLFVKCCRKLPQSAKRSNVLKLNTLSASLVALRFKSFFVLNCSATSLPQIRIFEYICV